MGKGLIYALAISAVALLAGCNNPKEELEQYTRDSERAYHALPTSSVTVARGECASVILRKHAKGFLPDIMEEHFARENNLQNRGNEITAGKSYIIHEGTNTVKMSRRLRNLLGPAYH